MVPPQPESKEKILARAERARAAEAATRRTHEPCSRRSQTLVAAGAARRSRRRARGVRAAARGAVGRRRCAPPSPTRRAPTGWRVNTWVKQGILLGFRFGDIVDASMDHGTLAVLRQGHAAAEEVRGSAPASASCPADRRSATARISRRGVICMPPMYVNIGAYVGEGSLIDSHALVGSCAQVGARVHVSAARRSAASSSRSARCRSSSKTKCSIGGNTGIYEGAIVKARAVIARRHGAHRIDAGLRPRRTARSSGRPPTSRSSCPKAPSSCRARAR